MPHALAEEVAADARRYVLGACSAYGDCKPTSLCLCCCNKHIVQTPNFI